MVNKPTVVATIRCPCSQKRLPTIFGNTWPFESGQSDVAKPASLLVTSAPAMIKKNVAQATSIANRFNPLFIEKALDCRLPESATGNQKSKMSLVSLDHWKINSGHHR